MSERRVYTAEFKLEAVRLSRQPDKTIAEVAASLGVGRSTLTAWRRHHRERGELAFPGHGRVALTPEEAEIQRLKRELEITRQERDILKKATAFFAKESR